MRVYVSGDSLQELDESIKKVSKVCDSNNIEVILNQDLIKEVDKESYGSSWQRSMTESVYTYKGLVIFNDFNTIPYYEKQTKWRNRDDIKSLLKYINGG